MFEKSHWTVTWQWSEVTRRLADCQTTFFGRFKQFENFLKKSLNGHATVVGGQATVGRLSDNVFCTFQASWNFFEKCHWTVTRQWSEVTRPSADCQTTFFVRFKQFEKFLKKVTERSRDSGRRSRDRRPTIKQRLLDVSSNLNFFEKSHWTVTRQWSEVTRPSADCQAHIFMNKRDREREREREREGGRERLSPLHSIRAPPCCAVGRFISRRPGWG